MQVAGEAGIGKSRLVTEVKIRAASEGFLELQGACFQMDSSCPYAPLLDMLRASVAANPHTETTDPIIQEFARLLPEFQLSSTPGLSTPLSDPEQEKRRLFAALARFFKARINPAACAACHRRPALVRRYQSGIFAIAGAFQCCSTSALSDDLSQ